MIGKSSSKARRGSEPAYTVERVAEVDFRLYRKRVKNLNIRIHQDGTVCVSAPNSMSLRKIKEFVESKSSWIERVRKDYAKSPISKAESASDEEKKQWREVIEATAPLLIAEWESILGVRAKKLVYRNMKSRWGSCQPETGRICLNTRLALYPPECLEYVVVHELCHLLVRGHGKDFYELMDGVMPDWKIRRTKLR